jgi:hypothetical protein
MLLAKSSNYTKYLITFSFPINYHQRSYQQLHFMNTLSAGTLLKRRLHYRWFEGAFCGSSTPRRWANQIMLLIVVFGGPALQHLHNVMHIEIDCYFPPCTMVPSIRYSLLQLEVEWTFKCV